MVSGTVLSGTEQTYTSSKKEYYLLIFGEIFQTIGFQHSVAETKKAQHDFSHTHYESNFVVLVLTWSLIG